MRADTIGLEMTKSWFWALNNALSVEMCPLLNNFFMGLRSLEGISGGLKKSETPSCGVKSSLICFKTSSERGRSILLEMNFLMEEEVSQFGTLSIISTRSSSSDSSVSLGSLDEGPG